MSQPRYPTERLMSLDAYRGFIMLLMASGGFAFSAMHKQSADSIVWRELAYQFDHVEWIGCSLWDLIQPSFMFMVGVALPYSYARRLGNGETRTRLLRHAGYRALILVLLGIFLSSNGSRLTNFTFVNVLTQIGLGYVLLLFALGRGRGVQLGAIGAVLLAYWFAFYLYPAPSADFDFASVGLSPSWPHLTGLAAHWDKNSNFASAFDRWFLNLFPRVDGKTFQFNGGGYQTLNFIPSLATMLFGVMTGELLRTGRPANAKFRHMVGGGVACLLVAMLLDHSIWPACLVTLADSVRGATPGWLQSFITSDWTVCPIVKRIWTPTWAIFSTGWTLLMLAGFYWVIDIRQCRAWSMPLVIVGMNSIAMYCMSQLLKPWIRATLRTHGGQNLFDGTYGVVTESTAVLVVLWLACYWLYRRGIFVRI